MFLAHPGHSVALGAIEVHEPFFWDDYVALDLRGAERAVVYPAMDSLHVVAGDVGDFVKGECQVVSPEPRFEPRPEFRRQFFR